MKNSDRFYNHVTGFIDDVSEVIAKYNADVERLERYQGSSGYDHDLAEARNKRSDTIKSLREKYWAAFQRIVDDMRTTVQTRPVVPPSAEQTALLTTLHMRTNLTRSELERAALQLAGCPLGLAVLDDLAEKHHIKGSPFNTGRDSDLPDRIDTLARSALRLIQEDVNAANQQRPENVIDCMEKYGGFGPVPRPGAALYGDITSADLVQNTTAISAFCEAVDPV